jgi:hypothetical protein
VEIMRKSYDFSNARPNPYAKRLKKQVTIRQHMPIVERHPGRARRGRS